MNPFLQLSPKKRAFLTGTLLLTGTGFACRVLGFFYRIFLSRTIGAEGLGLFNMIHPIYGICFALCAGSIQTALSQYIAAHMGKGRQIFCTGLGISLGMSAALAFLICENASFLAETVLMEPRCAPYLPIMGISVPFAALHACINGYYYGMQKSRVPAYSQVAEQVFRMCFVYLLVDIWTAGGRAITVELAVAGHLAGEIAAAAFTLICLLTFPPLDASEKNAAMEPPTHRLPPCLMPLMALALPLMGNRLVLNLLASAEAIWIPSRLQMSGLSNQEAFAVYGVLTGMAMPFILFPSTISNSMAVLLLPSVAQAQAEGRHGHITASVTLSLRYSLYMGILCIGIFTLFGNALGTSIFHDSQAGRFIQVLAWLCPFLYLATTMGSILNGLGHTRTTFLQNTAALLLRIGFVLVGIPHYGINAYLIGMLASELLLALLHLASLHGQVNFSWNAGEMIMKPTILLLISIGIFRFLTYHYANILKKNPNLAAPAKIPSFFITAFQIGVICSLYAGLLLMFHLGKRDRQA